MNPPTPHPSADRLRCDYGVLGDGTIAMSLFGPDHHAVGFVFPGALVQAGELQRCINSHSALVAALRDCSKANTEALETLECFCNKSPAPQDDCDCSRCETARHLIETSAAARSALALASSTINKES